ncbi:MAG TPA: hypothetical protein VE422_27205 [Terriglobia bacterium]|nr:hypothetical protein [Terriglobia bacterium]
MTLFDDPTSVRGFIKALIYGATENLRRNRLPALLSAIALLVFTAFALTSEFDERPQYRKWVLPEINNAEGRFFGIMQEAEETTDDLWRLQYFIEGHRRAKTVLQVARSRRPQTVGGRQAQYELIRYYELVVEELAIIRTEASLNDSYDYIAEWKRRNADLLPIRQKWVRWVQS